jgi:hypothetical protein
VGETGNLSGENSEKKWYASSLGSADKVVELPESVVCNPNENGRNVDAGNGVCRLLRSRGKLSLAWADDSYLTMKCIEVGEMNSARQFAKSAKSIKELSAPFREALIERVRETECIKYLIFSPSYGTANFQTQASVLCLTNRRWLVVHCEDDGSVTIAESSYDSTSSRKKRPRAGFNFGITRNMEQSLPISR